MTIRPDALRDANLTGDQQTVNRWFDATAFGAPTPGQFKRIDITERVRVRLEIISTNFFNHPNYDNPVTNITSTSGVGVITAVGGPSALDSSGARSFRTAVRLEF